MEKRTEEKISFKVGPQLVCFILLIIGVCLVVLSFLEAERAPDWWKLWGKNTVNTLGTTVVASSIVSLILEMSNLKSMFSKVLSNILGDDFPLTAYSNENLEKFHLKLIAHLCTEKINSDQLQSSLYQYEKIIRDATTEIYYQYHNGKYYFTPDEENGVFEVRSEIIYKIINKYGKENFIKHKIRTYSINGGNPEQEFKDNFKIETFTVNGKEIERDCIILENIPKTTYIKGFYDYKIKIYKTLGKEKENTIKLVHEYRMPISDISQSYKIIRSCKSLEHSFKIYPDKKTGETWVLQATAFDPFYCKQSENESEFKVEQSSDDSVRIRFNKWIFPGSGYVVTLKRNKN